MEEVMSVLDSIEDEIDGMSWMDKLQEVAGNYMSHDTRQKNREVRYRSFLFCSDFVIFFFSMRKNGKKLLIQYFEN